MLKTFYFAILFVILFITESFGLTAREIISLMKRTNSTFDDAVVNQTIKQRDDSLGITFTFKSTLYIKPPGRSRLEVELREGKKQITVTNGGVCYDISGSEPIEIPPDPSDLFITDCYKYSIDDVMLALSNYGIDTLLVGTSVYDDGTDKVDAYIIGAKQEGVISNQIWIEKKRLVVIAYVQVLNTQFGEPLTITTLFGNYLKVVDKYWYPHSTMTYYKGKPISKIDVDLILINTGVKDSLFDIPQH